MTTLQLCVRQTERADEVWTAPPLIYCSNCLMYFDFEDHRPDISPVGRAISWREGVLISIIIHMAMVIVLLTAPAWLVATAVRVPEARRGRQRR